MAQIFQANYWLSPIMQPPALLLAQAATRDDPNQTKNAVKPIPAWLHGVYSD